MSVLPQRGVNLTWEISTYELLYDFHMFLDKNNEFLYDFNMFFINIMSFLIKKITSKLRNFQHLKKKAPAAAF